MSYSGSTPPTGSRPCTGNLTKGLVNPLNGSLDPRSESVLKTLIETYLLEGEPVGSRLLSKRYPEHLSSATIRNVLSDLEEDAMVAQPHTSAGRIPTERAYRYYVNRWLRLREPDDVMGAQLQSALEGIEQDPEAWLRHASRVLAEVMGGVCIALPQRLASTRLVRMEFVPLDRHRLVGVWVGSLGEVEHQILENTWGFDAATLVELANFASEHFRGCTLVEMRQKLLNALQAGAGEARSMWERLSNLASRWPDSAITSDPAVVVSGLGQMGQLPEFEDLERFRSLVAAFEEHERLALLLNAFGQSAAMEVQLLLGSENPFLQSMPLATMVRSVPLGGQTWATFALMAPLRMDYGRILGGLAWWSQAVQRRAKNLD